MTDRHPMGSLISLLSGTAAAALAAAWLVLSWDGGLQVPPPLPAEPSGTDALMAVNTLAFAFLLVLPPLAVAAIIAGLPAWRSPAAKAGLAGAAFALVSYFCFLRACGSLVYGD